VSFDTSYVTVRERGAISSVPAEAQHRAKPMCRNRFLPVGVYFKSIISVDERCAVDPFAHAKWWIRRAEECGEAFCA
jgi:hypothetical protein